MSENAHQDPPRILVVDDEATIREILADFLSMEGFSVSTAKDGQGALSELSNSSYDMVLSDLKMPNMGGIELLEAVAKRAPSVVTVIMTGFGTVETAIDAMKRGAYDYIMKPFKMEEVVQIVRRGLEKRRLQAENLRLKEALSLYKVSEAIAASLSLEDVLKTVTDAAVQEVNADAVLLVTEDGEGGFIERTRDTNPHFQQSGYLGELDPVAVRDFFRCEECLLAQGNDGLRFFSKYPEGSELSSLIVNPLVVSRRTIGYLAACSFQAAKQFDEGQRKLLSIISNRASASIENAQLYENLKRTFNQTVSGFVNAIDKMDAYTAGHSEGVARYAELLANSLELAPDQVEVFRQSALMHDIGKIGCALNLNKPGKLSEEEYEAFKKHPDYGREILEPIRLLAPIISGVYSHHERWDGEGYPQGLKGEEIPLVARIIAVADAYDAMTSHRAYRKALRHEVTVAEIKNNAGTQFDPELARLFVEVIERYRKERRERGEPVPE
jgi:response regulator RpfG family c-di-GMP phosphodiesterase